MSEGPRHWRLNPIRYELRGVKFPCGHYALDGVVCYECACLAQQTESKAAAEPRQLIEATIAYTLSQAA